MSITITSVLTTCLLDSLLILLLCILTRRNFIIQKAGPGCIIVILSVSMIRMCFPFEFWYTYSWYVEDTLQPVMRILFYQVYSGSIEITIADVLLSVWCLGAVISLIYSIISYQKLKRYVSILPKEKWEDFLEKYHLKKEDYKGTEKIMIAYNQDIRSPCVIGLRHPCVLLPKTTYSEEQFKYIMMHEMMHVKNKDILCKVFIDLLCMVFWWNPIFRYLRKELFQLIEIHNDMKIVSELPEQKIVGYMEALKDTAVQMSKRQQAYTVPFNQGSKGALKRRLSLIGDATHFYRIWQAVLFFLAILMLFLTSAVIIEPYSFERIDEGTMVTSENTYLIINGDKYDVYIEGEYMMTVDNLEGFDDVNIYNNLEEVQKNE